MVFIIILSFDISYDFICFAIVIFLELIVSTENNDDIELPKLYNIVATLPGNGMMLDKKEIISFFH